MKRVLVIGASGLLGSNLVKALLGKAEIIESGLSHPVNKVDITNTASLLHLFQKVGLVDAIACTAGAVRFLPWTLATNDDWLHGFANKLMGQINIVRLGADFVREGGARLLSLQDC